MKLLSFIGVVIALVLVWQSEWFSIFKSGDIDAIRAFLKEERYTTLLITLLLMMIQNLFTLIPIVGIIMINITFFGFTYGYAWSVLTSVIGALSAFIIYRFWFQSLLLDKVKRSYLIKLEENGFFFVLVMRIIPFVPSSLINISAGVSSVRLMPYMIATALGNALYLLFLSLIANGLLAVELQGYLLTALILALIPGIAIYRLLKKKFDAAEKQHWRVRGD